MGQACSSQGCVASEAPKQVDESCKTPREAKTAGSGVPQVHVHAAAAAAPPANSPPAAQAPVNSTSSTAAAAHHAGGPQQHPIPEPKPFVDAAALHKPVEEVTLAGALDESFEPAAAAAHHGPEQVAAKTELPVDSSANEPPQHSQADECVQLQQADNAPEPHADLQDNSAQHAEPVSEAPAPAEPQADQQEEPAAAIAGEASADFRGRVTTGDAAATQHSINSNSSASRQHSGLTEAASPDVLHDTVSQSALERAPSATVSTNAASRQASAALPEAERSQAPAADGSGSGVQEAEVEQGLAGKEEGGEVVVAEAEVPAEDDQPAQAGSGEGAVGESVNAEAATGQEGEEQGQQQDGAEAPDATTGSGECGVEAPGDQGADAVPAE